MERACLERWKVLRDRGICTYEMPRFRRARAHDRVELVGAKLVSMVEMFPRSKRLRREQRVPIHCSHRCLAAALLTLGLRAMILRRIDPGNPDRFCGGVYPAVGRRISDRAAPGVGISCQHWPRGWVPVEHIEHRSVTPSTTDFVRAVRPPEWESVSGMSRAIRPLPGPSSPKAWAGNIFA
ncbi:MAG: hypothetical protein JWQ98_2176 [Chlorobi bacterium]|nr:hypothetical protein [Chlorobiota bacterium]